MNLPQHEKGTWEIFVCSGSALGGSIDATRQVTFKVCMHHGLG